MPLNLESQKIKHYSLTSDSKGGVVLKLLIIGHMHLGVLNMLLQVILSVLSLDNLCVLFHPRFTDPKKLEY